MIKLISWYYVVNLYIFFRLFSLIYEAPRNILHKREVLFLLLVKNSYLVNIFTNPIEIKIQLTGKSKYVSGKGSSFKV